MAYEVNPGHDPELFYHCACLEPGEADKLRADLDAAKARVAELEGVLRECIYQCESCKAFGTWTATTCYAAFRPFYCDACKAEHEVEVHQDGRLVGQLVYDDWRRADRNIELTRIYAPSTTTPSSTGERRE